jgi:hypothetical protein
VIARTRRPVRSERVGIGLALVAAVTSLLGCATAPPIRPVASAAPSEIEPIDPPLEGFYAKRLREGGIPVLGHASVSDEGLRAARDRLRRMLANAPKLRANLEAARHELHVVGLRQFTSDLPEHRDWRGRRIDAGELFDWHMIGGHIVGRFSSCTEATLLPIVGHRLFGDDTCMHELAHAVEALALGSALRDRIAEAYGRSIHGGRWKDRYASRNEHEWFAEITKHYFRRDGSALAFYDPYLARGREWLRGEDPEAFELVDALYAGRLDPGAPRGVRIPLGPAADEGRLKSHEARIRADLVILNRTAGTIRMVWLDYEGRRDPRRPFAEMPSAGPGGEIHQSSFASHPFVITDDAGRGLCTIVAGERDGMAEVTGECH